MGDLHFYFDPVCPFAWITSKWVRTVAAQRDYLVDWRFISLRQVNAHLDYDTHFPPEYEAGHTAGLKLLRVAAQVREEHGRDAVGALYAAYGTRLFEVSPGPDIASEIGPFVATCLADAELPGHLATAVDDASYDVVIQDETDEALRLTGKDVGTPIVHVDPPAGVAFFGPVISRLPSDAEAIELWDHVIGLVRFPGFAELKRSLRERPQLPALGVTQDGAGKEEDWHGGSRRQQK